MKRNFVNCRQLSAVNCFDLFAIYFSARTVFIMALKTSTCSTMPFSNLFQFLLN